MDRSLRLARRAGIARVVALAAVIVIGATVAAAGAVISLSQAGSSTTSVTIPAPMSTTSASSVSTPHFNAFSSTVSLGSPSNSSVPCLLNGTGLAGGALLNDTIRALVGNLTAMFNQGPSNATVAQLFGNFSQMTVTSDITGPLGLATSSSYQVLGRPMIGSLEYYEVSFNASTAGFNDTQVVMFAPNGTATSVSSPLEGNFTGGPAEVMGEGDVSSFLIALHSSAYASSIESDPSAVVLNSTTVYLGPTQVKMTYYTLKSLPMTYCGATLSELVEGIGTIQGTGITMPLYSQMKISEQGSTIAITTSVDSLKLA
jgi:hypothetical protein